MRSSVSLLWVLGLLFSTVCQRAQPVPTPPGQKRVAVLTTVYRHNSHADVIASRLVLTDMLDGTGKESPLKLTSLYVDQRPSNDISRLLAASHRFRLSTNIADALTLGTGTLAVDGVLLIAEHGDYPRSPSGNTQYPKRRFWDEMLKVFRASGRVVPVFVDKHLADNWDEARYIYETARELSIPLMAGSSLPGSWRFPPMDVPRGAELGEVVILTYGSTDHYGFHALECLQALVEQRRGGETGVSAVQSSTGTKVWSRLDAGVVSMDLLTSALQVFGKEAPSSDQLRHRVEKPILWQVEYADGLKASVLELNGAVQGWSGAWRVKGQGRPQSTRFWTQEARPAAHFSLLLNGIEKMMLEAKPAWRVERTLMSSGLLDALLRAAVQNESRMPTPWLEWSYSSDWRWKEPPPPPPSRPWGEQ